MVFDALKGNAARLCNISNSIVGTLPTKFNNIIRFYNVHNDKQYLNRDHLPNNIKIIQCN